MMTYLTTLPDGAKYFIGAILFALGALGTYLLQDTMREPNQRNNIVLRRIGYFWVETSPEVYQIGAVLRLYNLGSRPTFLRGVSFEAADPQFIGRGGATMRRLTIFAPTATLKDDNFLKAASEASYKILLPIRFEASIQGRPPGIAFIGTWKLQFWVGARLLQSEQSGTFDKIISSEEWKRLLHSDSVITPDQINYE